MDWQLSTFNRMIVPLFRGLIRTPAEKRDANAIREALQKTSDVWRIVDDQLQRGPYLAGDQFTIGHIPLGVWAYRWFNLPVERPELVHLHGWYRRLCDRLPYQKHIMIPLT
jgi:glutathione S-transferase